MELTEQEQQFYEELFQRCDLGKTTKIPVLVAGELFSSSGLPAEISLKIAEMCGATRLGYFGRSQFYIALKYIAAAQQHIPLNADVVGATSLSLPLINRVALNTQLHNHAYDAAIHSSVPESQPPITSQIPIMPSGTGVLPPPPTKKHVRNMSGTIQQTPAAGHQSQHNSTHKSSSSHSSTIAPQVADRNSTVQTDTPSIPESDWASFPSPTKNVKPVLTVVTSSSTQSRSSHTAGTPVEGPPASPDWNAGGSSCGVSKKSFNIDSCSLSSADYATSETSESTDDIWVINDEQREYYVNQFRGMQRDLTATIKGPVAKEFFERSKLPNNELSKIWKLSDVNRDGALTLQEFCTAMHLVVLKRNQVELPTVLPPSLMPYVPASSEPFAADLGDELPSRSPSPAAPPPAQHQNSWPGSTADPCWTADSQWSEQQRAAAGSDQWTNSEQQWQQTGSEVSVHWRPETAESVSPIQTQWTGSSHSPTSKPLQFDSAPALIVDSEIAVPVAMKMSPSSQHTLINVSEDIPENCTGGDITRERSSTSENLMSSQSLPVRPRPTPKKAQSVGATTVEPMMKYPPPQSVHGYQSLPGTSAVYVAPSVPPRNQWSISSPDADVWTGEAPNPTAGDTDDLFSASRKGNDENFADFSGTFGEPTNETFGAVVGADKQGVGDVHVHTPAVQTTLSPMISVPKSSIVHQFSIRDKKEIQSSIRKQRERNEMLVRSSNELHSELQEVVEQRISLEIQLEHIKPC